MLDEIPRLRPSSAEQTHRRGGAWKVAYADFVTALMALFIVMWLMNTSKQVQQAVAAYFRDPGRFHQAGPAAEGAGLKAAESIAIDQTNVVQLKEKLEQAVHSFQLGELEKMVQISITPEGLRVELLETEQGLFFESGRPEPSPQGKRVLALLAKELARLSNPLVIEGHTDARPYRFTGLNGYTNWELSVDRANAARRVIQDEGVRPEQVAQVRGFADKRLLNPADPFDSRNRRVSVVVQYAESGGGSPTQAPPGPGRGL
jgi:chemotaxis protein MotB